MVLEAEMVSEKLRDIILFHSYNNNVLTTYFNKIVEDNKLDYVVKESFSLQIIPFFFNKMILRLK